jgi:nucleoside-diphosphate-sugar epimerase
LARALIVGCGCRGRQLGAALAADGWQVRGTARTEAGVAAIEAAGIEAAVADPERVGSVLELVGDVAVVAWLLGSAVGNAEDVNGDRLEHLLERLVDTPVRGFVYEGAGSAPAAALRDGAALVRAAGDRFRIPIAILESAHEAHEEWTRAAAAAVRAIVGLD